MHIRVCHFLQSFKCCYFACRDYELELLFTNGILSFTYYSHFWFVSLLSCFEILQLKTSQLNKVWPYSSSSTNLLRPIKGNAILFFNARPNASPDKDSYHERSPVLQGDMWCATKFFHIRPINKSNFVSQQENDDCSDEDENCPQWAALGECQKNPVFMVGSPDYYGTCRKSCHVCWWVWITVMRILSNNLNLYLNFRMKTKAYSKLCYDLVGIRILELGFEYFLIFLFWKPISDYCSCYSLVNPDVHLHSLYWKNCRYHYFKSC